MTWTLTPTTSRRWLTKLDLKDAIHVGHSTGGGEVARYIGRHGTKRVAKAVLIGAVPPLMLKSEANPGGLPKEVFDQIRSGVLADRSQFFKDLTLPFYGYNRPGVKVSQGVRDSFWMQGMMAGLPACYFCIKAFSETDQTEDLKKIDVPTLILHGDDDQIVPIADSAMLSAKLVKNAKLKVYKGAPHGICTTHKEQVNEDLLACYQESCNLTDAHLTKPNHKTYENKFTETRRQSGRRHRRIQRHRRGHRQTACCRRGGGGRQLLLQQSRGRESGEGDYCTGGQGHRGAGEHGEATGNRTALCQGEKGIWPG